MIMVASSLDAFIASPRLHQVDYVDVGASQTFAWGTVRHLDMARWPLVRGLFSVRTLPERLRGHDVEKTTMRLDDIGAGGKGFRILDERPGESITLGAIGKVWQPNIEYADVPPDRFAAFAEPGWAKVAWELRCEPHGVGVTRVVVDLRVTTTDETSWQRFRRYFALIGPFSHLIRRYVLGMLARELGNVKEAEGLQPLPGDELLLDAAGRMTDGVTISARAEDVWPWLVQMGCRRAGWYSWDVLDNAGEPSAREILPEFQKLRVGDIIPATPTGDDGFEVLRIDEPRTLVLGGLYDLDTGQQRRFSAPRPERYWHVTWAFVLEPIDENSTRLHVRAAAAMNQVGLASGARMIAARFIHHFMEAAQLQNLRDRVEATRRTSTLTGRAH
jgi:hypothetical protein